MNVTAHQQKEETKKGKRGAAEKKKKKQAADFKEAMCCPSTVVQGQHSEKMKGSARGNWHPREVQQPFRPNPNGAGDRTTTLKRLLNGAEIFKSFVTTSSQRVRGAPRKRLALLGSNFETSSVRWLKEKGMR